MTAGPFGKSPYSFWYVSTKGFWRGVGDSDTMYSGNTMLSAAAPMAATASYDAAVAAPMMGWVICKRRSSRYGTAVLPITATTSGLAALSFAACVVASVAPCSNFSAPTISMP